mmetsp:Transcript_64459/g.207614  ORF Transcript_64459/g.207614 Transcript_64459/m.207614 type:complete len:200 (+) Transcript_64459:635-1234(+)
MVTFSPQVAYCISSSLMKTLTTVHLFPCGRTTHFAPGRTVPCSTLPMAMLAPMSLYPSNMGMRRGRSALRLGTSKESIRSRRVIPEYQAGVFFLTLMLSPVRPLMGRKMTWSSLKPDCFRKGLSFVLISLYLDSSHSTLGSSILLMAISSLSTPSVLASTACSRVWPPRSKPVSNSPFRAEMMSTPMSACEAPPIMLGT